MGKKNKEKEKKRTLGEGNLRNRKGGRGLSRREGRLTEGFPWWDNQFNTLGERDLLVRVMQPWEGERGINPGEDHGKFLGPACEGTSHIGGHNA